MSYNVNIIYVQGVENMSKNVKIFWICIISIMLLCWVISCSIDDSSDSDYDYYEDELTQQEKDNLEFYYEMEDAWDNYRNAY